MQLAVLYIPYANSYNEQTRDIITFAQFEEGNLAESKRNKEEDEPILDSIDESSTDDDSDDGSISTNDLKDIWDGSQIHPYIKSVYARLKIRDRMKQTKSERKGGELSEKRIGKVLH